MQPSEHNQEKIQYFRDTFGEEHFIFACQASIPFIFSTDLLYKLWLNFNTYKIEEKIFKIPHWAVSDLILSSFCEPVGYKLYKLDVGVRNHLQTKLVEILSTDRKFKIAEFIKQFAEKYYVASERNIQEIHLLTADSILNPERMSQKFVEKIESSQNGTSEIVNLLSLYFNLTGKTEQGEVIKNYISLVAENDAGAPDVLELMLPDFLKKRITDTSEVFIKQAEYKESYKDALNVVISCLHDKDNRLNLSNYELTDADFNLDGELSQLLMKCSHLEELVFGGSTGIYKSNEMVELPSTLSALHNLKILKAARIGLYRTVNIEHLSQLEYLDLGGNQIAVLEGIESLKKLKSIFLSHNRIKSVSALQFLDELTYIDLQHSTVEDLSPLYDFFKRKGEMLFTEFLVKTPPPDVLSKGHEYIIKYLDQQKDKFKVIDLIQVCIDKKATILDLGNCSLTEENFRKGTELEKKMQKCLHIETLVLSHKWWSPEQNGWIRSNNNGNPNFFSIVPPVFLLIKQLKKFICAGEEYQNGELSDLGFVHNWPELNYLDVSNNKFINLRGLEDATELTHLLLSNNRIHDIIDITDIESLEVLFLNKNEISDVSSLEEITNLRELNLQYNKIKDIQSLVELPNLLVLDISNNGLQDLKGLRQLVERGFSLFDSRFSDVGKRVYVSKDFLPKELETAITSGNEAVRLFFEDFETSSFIPRLSIYFEPNGFVFSSYTNDIETHSYEFIEEIHFLRGFENANLDNAELSNPDLKYVWSQLIPDEFKQLIRNKSLIILELDDYTMSFPWEKLIDESESPIGLKCTFIRKHKYEESKILNFAQNNVLILNNRNNSKNVSNIFMTAGFNVILDSYGGDGIINKKILSNSYKVIHLQIPGDSNEDFKNDHVIIDNLSFVAEIQVLPELVFLNFNDSEATASYLSKQGVQVISLKERKNSRHIFEFSEHLFESLLIKKRPLYSAFQHAQSRIRKVFGDDAASRYRCYGRTDYKLNLSFADEVRSIMNELVDMLKSINEKQDGLFGIPYVDSYKAIEERIFRYKMVDNNAVIYGLLAAVSVKLKLYNKAVMHYSHLLGIYRNELNTSEGNNYRNEFNQLLKDVYDSSLKQYEEITALTNEYERIREIMPVGKKRTWEMTKVFDGMVMMATDIIPLISLFRYSDVAGERLAAIAALQVHPDIIYCEWIADRIGDAEKFFVGFQASVSLLIAVQKLSEKNGELLIRLICRAKGNLYMSKEPDANQLNSLEESFIMLRQEYNIQKRLKAKQRYYLKIFEGGWYGFYQEDSDKTEFRLVFWFVDENRFIGVVKDDGVEDLADIEGSINWSEKIIEFTKRYRIWDRAPIYYKGGYESETKINGSYKVRRNIGMFEMEKVPKVLNLV